MVHAATINLTYIFHELQKYTHHIVHLPFHNASWKLDSTLLWGKGKPLEHFYPVTQSWWEQLMFVDYCFNAMCESKNIVEARRSPPHPVSPFCFSKILSPGNCCRHSIRWDSNLNMYIPKEHQNDLEWDENPTWDGSSTMVLWIGLDWVGISGCS